MSRVYEDKSGNLVELVEGQEVVCYPQGGGYQMRIPLATFLKVYTPVLGLPEFKLVKVAIDGDPDRALPAYCTWERWNGWAMPHFPIEVMPMLQAVIPGLTKSGSLWKYEDPNYPPQDPDDVEIWGEDEIEVNGKTIKVVALGAGSWCWEIFEE